MKRYQIICASSVEVLENMVNNEMNHGWYITGGLAVMYEEPAGMLQPRRVTVLQAMIHFEGNNV